MRDTLMILLLLVACHDPHSGTKGKDDTGSVDSPADSAPDETAVELECEGVYDTNIAYEPAEPCDPTLPWVDVSAGLGQTCGVKSDGCGQCWGLDMDLPEYAVPDLPLATIQMSAGVDTVDNYHICGLTLDGQPVCWGGPNDRRQNFAPVGTYVALATGSDITAAIRDDGSIQRWGYASGCARGPYREVVARNWDMAGLRADGVAELLVVIDAPQAYPGTWKQIALGFFSFCGIRTDQDDGVSCVYMGGELFGEDIEMPDRPEGRFVDVCASTGEACALDELGVPVCWALVEHANTLANPPPGPFVSITCGSVHACALTAGGRIECWGDDYFGETTPPS